MTFRPLHKQRLRRITTGFGYHRRKGAAPAGDNEILLESGDSLITEDSNNLVTET